MNHTSYPKMKYIGRTYIQCKTINVPEDGETIEEIISKGVREGWLVEVQSSTSKMEEIEEYQKLAEEIFIKSDRWDDFACGISSALLWVLGKGERAFDRVSPTTMKGEED